MVVTGYRWVVCGIAWASFALSFVDRLAWGNLQLPVGHALGLPLARLGIFVSAFYGGYVLSNLVSGYLTDRVGPRLTLSLSSLILGAATAGFGSIQSVSAGFVVQVVMGVAAGADYGACVKLLASWFAPRERGFAVGVWYTASSLAVVATNAVVPGLATGFGWQGAYRVLGAVTAGVAVLAWLTLRDAPGVATRATRPDVRALLADRDIRLASLAGFGALWGTWGFAFWANALMVRGHGMSPGRAAAIVALFGIGAAVAKPLIGWLSDRLGGVRKPLAIACLAAFAAMLLFFGTLQSETAIRLAAPLLGVTAFAYSPLTTTLVAEIAGRRGAGSASGITNAFWQLGNLLVPLAVGQVFAATLSYFAAFATLACGPALAVLALLAVREPAKEVIT